MIPFTVTEKSITVVVDNRNRQIAAGNINFEQIKTTLKAYSTGTWSEEVALAALRGLVDIPAFIATVTEGRVQINETQVMYNGAPVHGHAAERLLKMLNEGFNPRPLMRFLDRLYQNPVVTARDELLRWLEHSNLPLTPDGRFVAYKFVNSAYKDQYSNSVDNSIGGKIPKLSWDGMNTNRHATCAESGYHFCSFDYLGTGHPHVMLVVIAPEDVSSFPYDTEIAKGRCIFYEVIGEVPSSELGARMVEQRPVYNGMHAAPQQNWGGDEDEDGADEGDDDSEGEGVEPSHVKALLDTGASITVTTRKSNRESWIDRLKGIEHGGKRLTPARMRKLVRDKGQREVMRLTGIPRTTLQGWLKSQEKN